MAIDPTTPKESKNTLPKNPSQQPATKAALDYSNLVRMRELLLGEIIEDMGGITTINPEMLNLVEVRLANVILAGLDCQNLKDYLE